MRRDVKYMERLGIRKGPLNLNGKSTKGKVYNIKASGYKPVKLMFKPIKPFQYGRWVM